MKVAVQSEDFDLNLELSRMRAARNDIGAIVSFIGLVRDLNDGAAVTQLTLEHYPGMTEKALLAIVKEASSRWDVLDATLIHRVGTLQAAEQIVLVAVCSAHREHAFLACEFMMDYLKTQAPFWKKELTENGEHWLDDKASDHDALGRWKTNDL
ncbi:MAG: molybdenum cofactor biosynthesis protein MoaE [Methylotenera sp.]|nr:molybdenum cofactor biosynthesis protein MoaE [Methylotenera sp.]